MGRGGADRGYLPLAVKYQPECTTTAAHPGRFPPVRAPRLQWSPPGTGRVRGPGHSYSRPPGSLTVRQSAVLLAVGHSDC